MNIDKALHIEELRGRFLKHTRLAYRRLPLLEQPRILDIGCGPGQQTIELARLSGGEVVGIDTDPSAVSRLQKRIDQANAGDRIKVIHVSLFDNKFDDDCFDIIWEEGVFHLLDASKCFVECRRLLKPNGYLVMHETILWLESTKIRLPDFGFKLMDEHILPKHSWWTDYGAPLKDRIKAYRDAHGNASNSKKLAQYESVVASIESDPDRSDCGIYLVKRMDGYGQK
jgi:SAM-dependent methyltransferase